MGGCSATQPVISITHFARNQLSVVTGVTRLQPDSRSIVSPEATNNTNRRHCYDMILVLPPLAGRQDSSRGS